MATTEEHKNPPQQYKQTSRKGKRAWRKNVDLSQIQAGLEEARDEVIKGGIIAERPSESIFTLDTVGSQAIQSSYNKIHKPLKSDQILAKRSAVPSVSNRTRPSGVTDGVLNQASKRRKRSGVNPVEYERLRGVAYGAQSVKDVIKTDEAPTHDPWAVKTEERTQEDEFTFLEKSQPIRAPKTLKEAPISLVESVNVVPAVAKPKGGTSYNPDFQDWSALLASEGAKAVEAEKRRLKEVAIENERLARIAAAEREASLEADLQTEDESAWEGFESNDESGAWIAKKRPERKTPTERRKVERRKERERKEKMERMAKSKAQREKEIGLLKKEVDREAKRKEQALAQASKQHEQNGQSDEQVLRRRKLGKDVPSEPALELVLPDELQESLRLLKPEGNLLKDRFRNVLLSGKMETRKPVQQAKKKARTYTEKWSYKDWQLAA